MLEPDKGPAQAVRERPFENAAPATGHGFAPDPRIADSMPAPGGVTAEEERRGAGEDWVLALIAIFVFVGATVALLILWFYILTWR